MSVPRLTEVFLFPLREADRDVENVNRSQTELLRDPFNPQKFFMYADALQDTGSQKAPIYVLLGQTIEKVEEVFKEFDDHLSAVVDKNGDPNDLKKLNVIFAPVKSALRSIISDTYDLESGLKRIRQFQAVVREFQRQYGKNWFVKVINRTVSNQEFLTTRPLGMALAPYSKNVGKVIPTGNPDVSVIPIEPVLKDNSIIQRLSDFAQGLIDGLKRF